MLEHGGYCERRSDGVLNLSTGRGQLRSRIILQRSLCGGNNKIMIITITSIVYVDFFERSIFVNGCTAAFLPLRNVKFKHVRESCSFELFIQWLKQRRVRIFIYLIFIFLQDTTM